MTYFDNFAAMSEVSQLDMQAAAPAGLDADTRLQTDRGLLPASAVKAGDSLRDAAGELVRVTAVIPGTTAALPIVIRAGALGADLPTEDTLVAPGQRILLSLEHAAALFGHADVLVTAGDLLHLPGVEVARRPVSDFVQFLFEDYTVIAANALTIEAFVPCEDALEALPDDTRQDVFAALPRLRFATGVTAYLTDTIALNGREIQSLTTPAPARPTQPVPIMVPEVAQEPSKPRLVAGTSAQAQWRAAFGRPLVATLPAT